MSLVSGFDFPRRNGFGARQNVITQYRPIAVTDTVDVAVHAENLREHRKGLLVDVVTDIKVGNDTAWHQVTTFLHQRAHQLSDEPKRNRRSRPSCPHRTRFCASPGADPALRVGRRDLARSHQSDRSQLFGFRP
jgi:hypothetical protein